MEDILVKDYADESEDILSHHGILGQKWGVRRFQNADGSYTRAGEERRRKSFRLETREERDERLAKKSARKAVQQVKKAEKAAKRDEQRERKSLEDAVKLERKKAQILRSGDADKIYKNQKLFTDQEINTALNRLRQNEQVRLMGKDHQKSVAKAEKDRQRAIEKDNKKREKEAKAKQTPQQNKQQAKNGKSTVQKLWDAGKMAAGMYATYNQVAKAVNSITGEETMPNFSTASLKGWTQSKKPSKDEYSFNSSKGTNVNTDNLSFFDTKRSSWYSSSSTDNDINIAFDAVTMYDMGDYAKSKRSSGYNWAGAMKTPIKEIF